jgi:hypothetical protein
VRHSIFARYPAGDHRNYKAREPHRCRCAGCTSAYTERYNEYRRRVVAEVRAGRRPEPRWLANSRRRGAEREARRTAKRRGERSTAEAAAANWLELVTAPLSQAVVRGEVYVDGPRVNARRRVVVASLRVEVPW